MLDKRLFLLLNNQLIIKINFATGTCNCSYPVELHMLFYYYSYGSVESASEHPDGLVVLAFMYSVSEAIINISLYDTNKNFTLYPQDIQMRDNFLKKITAFLMLTAKYASRKQMNRYSNTYLCDVRIHS